MIRNIIVTLAAVVSIGGTALAGSLDGVQLTVAKGPGSDDVTLSWGGGLPLFQVYRSTLPQDVVTPQRLRAETNDSTAIDTTPSGTGIFYYQVEEYCQSGRCPLAEIPARAPGEPCDGCGGIGQPEGPIHSTYLFSGEFYLSAEDLRIKGRGPDFVWSRKYRSRLGSITPLGFGWDFSYNVRIEANGPDIIVHDGNTRSDLYLAQLDGTWARREFFRVLSSQPDGAYRLTFSDTSQWNFKPLNGSPAQGKIASSIDRNGNALSFSYDGAGRLVSVTDTLGRLISIGYNVDGFIQSVTDFTGRQVQYGYYQNAEVGGSPGDLKSVRSPTVTGTPNGNDFPVGKTVVYTYATGMPLPELNHNLLTITDPRGQTYLQNGYDPTLNPLDPNFDHLIHQVWGDPGDFIDVVYVQQVPDVGNNFARNKAIVNDRVGNVRELLYDSRNRLVIEREFTGRANPDLPTTDNTNRPTGKLRPDDPDSFETRYEYNDDSLMTRVIYPNGNSVQRVHELDLNPLAPRRSRGNLREHHRLPGPLGGDQAEIVELFEYDPGIGGCCGTNFVTRHVDGRGRETLHTYDARGNRLHTQHRIPSIVEDYEYNSFGQMTAHILPDNGSGNRRRDERSYYFSGPQEGYLRLELEDATGFALPAYFEYDFRGNVVRRIDHKGHDTIYTVNALDQVVREAPREVTDGSGIRYRIDTFYDADDNVSRIDVRNQDQNGVIQPNAVFTTLYDYEILNKLIRVTQEVDETNDVKTEYDYDDNRNQVETRYGEAANGNDPFNKLVVLHDERDRPFRKIRAQGFSGQSTDQIDYDGNLNIRRTQKGLESSPRTTLFVYDGYNRRTRITDPMGNVTEYHYDANGNLGGDQSQLMAPNPFAIRVSGEMNDVGGSAGNIRLSQKNYSYDAMDRRTQEAVEHFTTADQLPVSDGQSVTQTQYSANSQVTLVVDDNGHTVQTTYDTDNRRSTRIDPRGNTITYGYDLNSNIISVIELDRSDGGSDETITTSYEYDNLDRLTRSTDNAGNVTRNFYDSRSNRVRQIDARNNVTDYVYDGMNRLRTTTRIMTDTGDGSGVPVDPIQTTRSYDESSRVIAQTDDNLRTTRYAYDALNRRIVTQMADGTLYQVGSNATWTLGAPSPNLISFVSGYDVHDNMIKTTDANGSVVDSTFDLLDRTILKTILPAGGVQGPPNGTTVESYAYDGLSRLVDAQDNDSDVTRTYDSLSFLTREGQQVLPAGPVRATTATYDGVGRMARQTYPSSVRVIDRTYDLLDRPLMVRDFPIAGTPIATYGYIGSMRVESRNNGNFTHLDIDYDTIRRVTRTFLTKTSPFTVLDDRQFAWDSVNNKIQAQVISPAPVEFQTFGYDSANRLRSSQNLPDPPIGYVLDGVGNRLSVSGGSDPGPYTCNGTLSEPADCQMNQYTTTPFDNRTYDRNGNLTDTVSPPQQYRYDYRNRLTRFIDVNSGQVTTYRYDCFGRRIEESVSGVVTRFYYWGSQEIDEEDAAGASLATYVWGPGRNELLQMRRGAQRYYYHVDDLGSIVKIMNSSGNLTERNTYQDFGKPSFFDASGVHLSQSAIGNPYLFRGFRFYPESISYFMPTGNLDTRAGRMRERDPRGPWRPGSVGNPFTFSGDNPLSGTPATSTTLPGIAQCATVIGGACIAGGQIPSWADLAVGTQFMPAAQDVPTPVPQQEPPKVPGAGCGGRVAGGGAPPCAGPCGAGPYNTRGFDVVLMWGCDNPNARKYLDKACTGEAATLVGRVETEADEQCMRRGGSEICWCSGDADRTPHQADVGRLEGELGAGTCHFWCTVEKRGVCYTWTRQGDKGPPSPRYR